MAIWAVTVVEEGGHVVNIPMKGRSIGDVLKMLVALNRDRLFDAAIERIDIRRVKEQHDAE